VSPRATDTRLVPNPKAIVSIGVDRLFGNRSYQIPAPGVDRDQASKLLILYGDNGSGKTTLLRMLHSVLSPARGGGFKSFLARTPFASLAVEFFDGTRIAAVRPLGELVGTFELTLRTRENTFSVTCPADAQNRVRFEASREKEFFDFVDHVRELGLGLYYLSDDRRLQTIHISGDSRHEDQDIILRAGHDRVRLVREQASDRVFGERVLIDEKEPKGFSLETTVEAFETWTRQQALRASSRGEGNANTIYADVVKRITTAYHPSDQSSDPRQVERLQDRLLQIAKDSVAYASLGLISPVAVDELSRALELADDRSKPIVVSVLEPYVKGLEARLGALQELKDVLATFIRNVNELYAGKQVEFNLRQGLHVKTDDGKALPFDFLSSGEKQLLILLCNTIIARDRTSIFVIDEPELSLNVKWQRKLVKTLLECVAGSTVQFILATHSIELISPYRENVVKLEPAEWAQLSVAPSLS
jgi:energy-coupling factor transporter ATP-binding protein EcfA2